MKKRQIYIIGGISILIIAAAVAYLTFGHIKECPDKFCFDEAMEECSKRSYIDNTENAIWLYSIKGKSGGECEIGVELLQLKEGTIDLARLEGKEMLCSLPIGAVANPRTNLERCHGLLKEELQRIIIDNLHTYITDNLGQISGEVAEPL